MAIWNVERELVEQLLQAGIAGINSQLQAAMVFQHCAVHDLSLFDFLSQFRVEGFSLVRVAAGTAPFDGCPALEHETEPPVRGAMRKPVGVVWKYGAWRDETQSVNRLEMLRKHIAEVQRDDPSNSWLGHLREQAAQLARVVEPVPTLGMVADDDIPQKEVPLSAATGEAEHGESERPGDAAESGKPQCSGGAEDQAADVAAVLANPRAAAPAVDADEIRKDSRGNVLVTRVQLEEIYRLGERLGMNRIQVQESACKRLKLRAIEDLPKLAAEKVIDQMRAKAGAA